MRFLCLLSACVLLGGCATIINGSNQSVSITSDPPGATVRTVDGNCYTTPTKIMLPRSCDHVLTVSMPGYQTEQVQLTKTLSGAVAGNIIAGGLIGWGVDAASGAQYKLIPSTVALRLRPAGYTYTSPSHSSASPVHKSYTAPPVPVPAASTQPAPSAPPPLTLADRLYQLDCLRNDGVVSEAEYHTIRADLIREFSHKD